MAIQEALASRGESEVRAWAQRPRVRRYPLPDRRATIDGRLVRIEPLEPVGQHDDLFDAAGDEAIRDWMGFGPFAEKEAMQA